MATDDSTRGIAAQWWEELREFRTTHPPKRVTVDGVGWEYIATGAEHTPWMSRRNTSPSSKSSWIKRKGRERDVHGPARRG